MNNINKRDLELTSTPQNYFSFLRPEMKKVLPKTYSKVLEIGCGHGFFRDNLNTEHEYWGVELDADAAQAAHGRLDKVLTGVYDSVQQDLPDAYFDLVICNDVIEHMDDYEKFLREIQTKLTKNANLVVSLPNVRFLPNLFELIVLKDWRYRGAGILDKTHLRFFTRKSIIRTLGQTGWSIETIQGVNRYGPHAWSPKRLISYLCQPILGRDTAFMQFAARARLKT